MSVAPLALNHGDEQINAPEGDAHGIAECDCRQLCEPLGQFGDEIELDTLPKRPILSASAADGEVDRGAGRL